MRITSFKQMQGQIKGFLKFPETGKVYIQANKIDLVLICKSIKGLVLEQSTIYPNKTVIFSIRSYLVCL